MRLLYVCSDFGIPPSGTKGASVHLRAITRQLSKRGHEVQLLSPREGPGDNHPVSRVLPPGCPPTKKSTKVLKQWLIEHEFNAGLAGELRSLVYNQWARDQALDALEGAAPAVIIERLSLLGHVGLDLAETLGVPLIVEVNALLTEEARAFRTLEMRHLAEVIERRMLSRANAVITVSVALADRVEALGVMRDRIHVVPNGADIEVFDATPPRDACRQELDLRDELVIGFVGSLKPWHGMDLLLSAFAKLHHEQPQTRLLIVGTGPREATLRAQVDRLALDEVVTFTGAVSHERVPALLRAMDVAVAPYPDLEGFYFSPIKLFEYMAAGTCVVASRLGQIAEVIEDGIDGLLFEPGDEADLLAVLRRACDATALRVSLGERGQRTVRTKYTWARSAELVDRVIQEVLANRSTSARPRPTAASSRIVAGEVPT